MKNEDPNTARHQLSRALSPPFAQLPLRLEFVMWEKMIPLRTISNWHQGDFLSLQQAGVEELEVRLAGLTVGRGSLKETSSAVLVRLTDWPGKDL